MKFGQLQSEIQKNPIFLDDPFVVALGFLFPRKASLGYFSHYFGV